MKYILFVALVAFSSFLTPCFACRCDSKTVDQIMEKPESLTSFSVGIYSSKDHSINVVKGWDSSIKKIIAGGASNCDYTGLKDGAYYLVLANGFNSEMAYANTCNSLLVPLTESSEFMVKLSKKNLLPSINPAWQFCEKDSECIKVKNQCDNMIGLNKKFQQKYLEYFKSNEKQSCKKESERSSIKSFNTKCVNNFCS